MHEQVIECILGYWVQYGSCYGDTHKFENKNKMADSPFAISNQSNVEQLNENSKNQNILKGTPTCVKVWKNWVTEKKANQKIESRSTKRLIKCCKTKFMLKYDCWEYNKQKILWLAHAFLDLCMVTCDVLKFSNSTRLQLVEFWEL